jgi:hypothetical protein
MGSGVGWYFISIVRQTGRDVLIDKLDADAVFADNGPDATRIAATRNPLRPGQEFATTKVNNRREREKAIQIAGERTDEIAKLQEILEFRCGPTESSS